MSKTIFNIKNVNVHIHNGPSVTELKPGLPIQRETFTTGTFTPPCPPFQPRPFNPRGFRPVSPLQSNIGESAVMIDKELVDSAGHPYNIMVSTTAGHTPCTTINDFQRHLGFLLSDEIDSLKWKIPSLEEMEVLREAYNTSHSFQIPIYPGSNYFFHDEITNTFGYFDMVTGKQRKSSEDNRAHVRLVTRIYKPQATKPSTPFDGFNLAEAVMVVEDTLVDEAGHPYNLSISTMNGHLREKTLGEIKDYLVNLNSSPNAAKWKIPSLEEMEAVRQVYLKTPADKRLAWLPVRQGDGFFVQLEEPNSYGLFDLVTAAHKKVRSKLDLGNVRLVTRIYGSNNG